MKFLVIGGTGRIGSKVVERLRVAGMRSWWQHPRPGWMC